MKAKFLVPVGALAAAMAAEHANAAISPPNGFTEPHQSATATVANPVPALEPQELTVRGGNDAYEFVLKRAEGGQLMVDHSSHSSHSSHYSHRSSSS